MPKSWIQPGHDGADRETLWTKLRRARCRAGCRDEGGVKSPGRGTIGEVFVVEAVPHRLESSDGNEELVREEVVEEEVKEVYRGRR